MCQRTHVISCVYTHVSRYLSLQTCHGRFEPSYAPEPELPGRTPSVKGREPPAVVGREESTAAALRVVCTTTEPTTSSATATHEPQGWDRSISHRSRGQAYRKWATSAKDGPRTSQLNLAAPTSFPCEQTNLESNRPVKLPLDNRRGHRKALSLACLRHGTAAVGPRLPTPLLHYRMKTSSPRHNVTRD